VVALTEYDDGAGTNGRLAERYAYTPYGEFVVTKGDGGSGELGRTLPASSVGNFFFHQGLAFDQEKVSYQNRRREYAARTQSYTARDPLGYSDGHNRYQHVRSAPTRGQDPLGLRECNSWFCACRCWKTGRSGLSYCDDDCYCLCRSNIDRKYPNGGATAIKTCVVIHELCHLDNCPNEAEDTCTQESLACLKDYGDSCGGCGCLGDLALDAWTSSSGCGSTQSCKTQFCDTLDHLVDRMEQLSCGSADGWRDQYNSLCP